MLPNGTLMIQFLGASLELRNKHIIYSNVFAIFLFPVWHRFWMFWSSSILLTSSQGLPMHFGDAF